MAGAARYSEADRRGRNSNQDVTNIGVTGRKTGLQVTGARRGSDGFENESAFFSPATTIKKQITTIHVESAVRGSESYEDMELQESSIQDVPSTLRRRGESPSRRAVSPTKTNLNSPALRVRSASRQLASPSKSASRGTVRQASVEVVGKIARKLDFRKPDAPGDAPDESMLGDFNANPPLQRQVSEGSAPEEDHDETGDAEVMDGSLRSEENAEAEEEDEVPAFEEYINDDEEMQDSEPVPATSKSASLSHKDRATHSPVDAEENNDEEEEEEEDGTTEAAKPRKLASKSSSSSQAAKKANARSAPVENNENEVPRKKRGTSSKPHNAKSAKVAPRPSFSPTKVRDRSARTASPQREWREPVTQQEDAADDDQEKPDVGVRKSSRFKIAPLAFWRGEKIVFGRGTRRKSVGGTVGLALPEVKEVIHVDLIDEEGHRLPKNASRRTRKTQQTRYREKIKPERGASARRVNADGAEQDGDGEDDDDDDDDDDDEEDDPNAWEEAIPVEAAVRSFHDDTQLVKKVLAWPQSAYDPRPVVGQDIYFQKTFADEDHFAAGLLDVPVGAAKPVKPSNKNTMFFFLHTGYVQVKIHDVVFRLRRGGQFIVPRSNYYEIKNVGKKDARLFFSTSTDTLANYQKLHPEVLSL